MRPSSFTRPARVWKRLLAFLLDMYLGIMICSSFLLVIESEVPHSLDQAFTSGLTPVAMAAVLYASIFILLYHVFCEYILGQTPGMLLFGLRVEQVANKRKSRSETETATEDISFWQALTRNCFIMPLFPLTLLWIVEPLYYLFQGERILEYWSNTRTVE